jgi:hypothetical protein
MTPRFWDFSFRHRFLRYFLALSFWKELSIAGPNHNVDLAIVSVVLIGHYLILGIIELRLNIILKRLLQCTLRLRWLDFHTFNVLLNILVLILLNHIRLWNSLLLW